MGDLWDFSSILLQSIKNEKVPFGALKISESYKAEKGEKSHSAEKWNGGPFFKWFCISCKRLWMRSKSSTEYLW